MTIQAEQFMYRAIELAEQGLGRTAPNPAVGAVVVSGGVIVGEGFHPRAGQPHAEIVALHDAGDRAKGADLYVTLEPCCHQGRTGPCADALIEAGVARVIVGTVDPNPKVAGKGIERLKEAGIVVSVGIAESACKALIAPFTKFMLTGLPYVVFKAAMTLDGQIAAANGDAKWISCQASRELVHQLRDRVDAIMVGSGTVIADNPRLTTRLELGGHDPVRIVLDGRLRTSPTATVYTQDSLAGTVLVTSAEHTQEEVAAYRQSNLEIVQLAGDGDSLDLAAVMQVLADKGLYHVLLEGGSALGGAMLRAGLVDRVMFFVAPKLLGGAGRSLLSGPGSESIARALTLKDLQTRHVGTDILIEGEVENVYRTD